MSITTLGLMNAIYGPYTKTNWPKKLPYGESGQGRYLWVDAFGVLNYVGLAAQNFNNNRKDYLDAAHDLVDAVHNTLGKPRDPQLYPMTPHSSSPTGFVGLRIGKPQCQCAPHQSDYGMTFDGQYFHYIDKWLFALLRLGQESEDFDRIQQAARWAKLLFPYFYDTKNCGIRWKLNIDSTPITPKAKYSFPNEDNLNAFIIFSLVENATKLFLAKNPSQDGEHITHLSQEIGILQESLTGYQPRVTSDPLGWGLECWMDQWVLNENRVAKLKKLAPVALHHSHLSLPFRLYGAMLGARLVDIDVSRLTTLILEHEEQVNVNEHSGINRVMLGSVLLCPGAPFSKREDEPKYHVENFE